MKWLGPAHLTVSDHPMDLLGDDALVAAGKHVDRGEEDALAIGTAKGLHEPRLIVAVLR